MNLYNIKKYLDPRWKYVILKKAIDDIEDEVWLFTETEKDAILRVENETEAYGNNPSFQFWYEKV